MASGLEAYCHDALRRAGIAFGYESEVIELCPAFGFNGTYLKSTKGKTELADSTGKRVLAITYKPDFVSHTHRFYIETKGYVPSQHTFHLRWKLFLRWLVDNGREDYMVFLPKNNKQVDACIRIIQQRIRSNE